MKTIDILVKAIDNFGDFWFALDLSEAILSKNPDISIRFFGDDEKLFQLLTQGKIRENILYFPLENYTKNPPSETVILCFDMKADMDFFLEQSYKIHIFILTYLRFDSMVGSMNETEYSMLNVTVTHLVPSPRDDGAGIIIRDDIASKIATFANSQIPDARKEFFTSQNRTIPEEILSLEWNSVFCYPDGKEVIQTFIETSQNTAKMVWIFFEDRTESELIPLQNGQYIWKIPYLRFDAYEILLSLCERNIVRWENSAMKALLVGKPFLWDIYKESNDAHFGKLEEFFEFISGNPTTKNLFLEWNTKPEVHHIETWLKLPKIEIPSTLKNITGSFL